MWSEKEKKRVLWTTVGGTAVGLVLAVLVFFGIIYILSNPAPAYGATPKKPAVVTTTGVPSAVRSPYVIPRSLVYFIDTEESAGSGIMIAPHRMLSVAHVLIEDGKPYDKPNVIINGKAIPIKRYAVNTSVDLALLDVDIDCPCASLAELPVEVDVKTVTVGYPVTTPVPMQYIMEGTAQGYNNGLLYTSANASPGASGGGVFVLDGSSWKLAGILSRIYANRDIGVYYISMAVPSKIAIDFIKQAEEYLKNHELQSK